MSNSNLCAFALLEAISGRVGEDCSKNLDMAERLIESSRGDTAEDERFELLSTITARLRRLAALGCIEDARGYVGILRHLAGPAMDGDH